MYLLSEIRWSLCGIGSVFGHIAEVLSALYKINQWFGVEDSKRLFFCMLKFVIRMYNFNTIFYAGDCQEAC